MEKKGISILIFILIYHFLDSDEEDQEGRYRQTKQTSAMKDV